MARTAATKGAAPAQADAAAGQVEQQDRERIEQQIRERAYALFEQSGRVDGHDMEHWFAAETAILAGKADDAV